LARNAQMNEKSWKTRPHIYSWDDVTVTWWPTKIHAGSRNASAFWSLLDSMQFATRLWITINLSPMWMFSLDCPQGLQCCADYLISCHYVSPDDMRVLDYIIYHVGVAPYGAQRTNGSNWILLSIAWTIPCERRGRPMCWRHGASHSKDKTMTWAVTNEMSYFEHALIGDLQK